MAPVQASAAWQFVQVVGKPEWSMVAAAASSAWQLWQSSWADGAQKVPKSGVVWHAEHGSGSWAPTRSKPPETAACWNGPAAQAAVWWHAWQSVGKPLATCGTALDAVDASASAWQATQSVGRGAKAAAWTPSAWQLSQLTCKCEPVSGNAVPAWTATPSTSRKSVGVWHVWQSEPRAPRWTSRWQVPHSVTAASSPSKRRPRWQLAQSAPSWRPSRR